MEHCWKIQINDELRDRIRGCLLGVAIGDALGAPFELSRPRFNGWIDAFHPWDANPPGTWTDDTGMTLATCRALLGHLETGMELMECLGEEFKR